MIHYFQLGATAFTAVDDSGMFITSREFMYERTIASGTNKYHLEICERHCRPCTREEFKAHLEETVRATNITKNFYMSQTKVPSRPYTDDDFQFVRDHYKDYSFDEFKGLLNRNGHQVGHIIDVIIRERIKAAQAEAPQEEIKDERPPAENSNNTGYLALQKKYG